MLLIEVLISFADRDMLMRYLGGGIGHKALWSIVKIADTLAALRGNSRDVQSEGDMDTDDSEPLRTILHRY